MANSNSFRQTSTVLSCDKHFFFGWHCARKILYETFLCHSSCCMHIVKYIIFFCSLFFWKLLWYLHGAMDFDYFYACKILNSFLQWSLLGKNCIQSTVWYTKRLPLYEILIRILNLRVDDGKPWNGRMLRTFSINEENMGLSHSVIQHLDRYVDFFSWFLKAILLKLTKFKPARMENGIKGLIEASKL